MQPFASTEQYREFRALRDKYRKTLAKNSFSIPLLGYTITSVGRDKQNMAVCIEGDGDSREFVEDCVRENLRMSLEAVSIEEKIKMFYRDNKIIFRAEGNNQIAFLDAYRLILEREM
jgi:hypothetical protein